MKSINELSTLVALPRPAVTALFTAPFAALGLAAGTAAHAQQSSSEPIDEVVVSGSYTVEDKLDTATGLGLSIWETPQSVTVMTAQRIADQDLQSLADVVLYAAGISAKEYDSARDNFSARGFSIDNYQIDGVPIMWDAGGDAGETQSDTSIYERIEVVRGATGLLTGAGNPSASINLVRKHADSRELTGQASLGAGRWSTYNANVDLSTPLNQEGSIRGRFVANYADGESWTDYLGNQKSVLYGVFDFDIGESTLLRAGLSRQDNEPTASTWGGLPSWYADGTRTNWDRSKTIGADWTNWSSVSENQFVNLDHEFANGWRAQAQYNHVQNDAVLELLYIYGAPDANTGLGLSPFPYRSDTSRDQQSFDFRLSGNYEWLDRDHEVIFGYSVMDQDFVSYSNLFSDVADLGDFNAWDGSYPEPTWGEQVTDIDTGIKQRGFYAATRLALTDALNLVVGARLSNWSEVGLSYGDDIDYGDSSVVIPYAGVLYDFSDWATGYVSYTEIFRPQNSRDRNGDYLDPVVGESFEVGVKSSFFDGAMHVTGAVFDIEQDNLAQPDQGFLIPGTIFQASRAARGARSQGFEFEVVGRPIVGWDVSFSYTKFRANDATGVAVNTEQPRELMKFFTTYNFTDSLADLTIGGGVSWEGPNYMNSTNLATFEPERLQQDSYSLVNLMARYDFNDRLSGQVNLDNLFDEDYYSQIGFYDQLAFGEPRNVSFRIRYNF